jgi:predicted kinase
MAGKACHPSWHLHKKYLSSVAVRYFICSFLIFCILAHLLVCTYDHPQASGKSSWAKKHLVSSGYVWVNQDTLKTKEKCVAAAKSALESGKSPVIDNTNSDRATRALYIKLAKQFSKFTHLCFTGVTFSCVNRRGASALFLVPHSARDV